jgi:hypothetical protein
MQTLITIKITKKIKGGLKFFDICAIGVGMNLSSPTIVNDMKRYALKRKESKA